MYIFSFVKWGSWCRIWVIPRGLSISKNRSFACRTRWKLPGDTHEPLSQEDRKGGVGGGVCKLEPPHVESSPSKGLVDTPVSEWCLWQTRSHDLTSEPEDEGLWKCSQFRQEIDRHRDCVTIFKEEALLPAARGMEGALSWESRRFLVLIQPLTCQVDMAMWRCLSFFLGNRKGLNWTFGTQAFGRGTPGMSERKGGVHEWRGFNYSNSQFAYLVYLGTM